MSPQNSKKNTFLNSYGTEKRIKQSVDYLNFESLIRFNFKYYIYGKDFGQSFNEWQTEGILVDLNDKLFEFSSCTVEELKKSKRLVIYDQFPVNSKFKEPVALKHLNVKWARLRLTGRRRLIGVMFLDSNNSNVFYIVFLDKEHHFFPTKK